MLSIRLLGALEVERDGEVVDIPGTKTRTLLARLALEVGSVVSARRLIDAVWGEDLPAKATNALQARVSELRRVLGAGVIVSKGAGYALAIEPMAVDWCQATALVAQARQLAAVDPDRASSCYSSALALWRGRDIAGLVEPLYWTALVSRLEELRLAAFEERAQIEIDAGRGRHLFAELAAASADYPLRESLVGLEMLAYAANGRQADALAAFRSLRDRMVDQLGVEPGPHLQTIEARVLAQDPATVDAGTAVHGAGSSAPASTPLGRSVNASMPSVPNPISSFIDRPQELAAVVGLVAKRRLVTITGPGGAGKTRLAIEAVRRIDSPVDGIWFVPLDSVTEIELFHDALGAVLGIVGAETVKAVKDRLNNTSLLLVLDNCEHLADGLRGIVRELLESAPTLRVLATSQRALGIPGEALVPLGPMPQVPAVELFLDRARDLAPDLRLEEGTESRALVEDICAQIGNLPLAIELAAGRCDVLSLDEIADHLRSGFGVLRDVSGTRAARHQTLDSTISWSYGLLFPDAQLALQALAYFVGGASLEGLTAVVADLGVPADEVLDLVSHLVERSVVVSERLTSGSRYHLLDSIRAFAKAQAAAGGRADRIGASHAAWVCELARRVDVGVHTSSQVDLLRQVRSERANVDAGLVWLSGHDPVRALEAASRLYYAWLILGDGPAGASRIENALVAAGALADAGQRALARARAAQLLARCGLIDKALAFSAEAINELTDEPEPLHTDVASIRGRVLVHAGRYDEGCELVHAACRRFEESGDAWGLAMGRLTIGWAAALSGKADDARVAVSSALSVLEPGSDAWIAHAAHRLLGVLDAGEGRYDDALAHYSIALETARAMGSATDEGQTLARIGAAQVLAGSTDVALGTLMQAAQISSVAGDHVTGREVNARIEALRSARLVPR